MVAARTGFGRKVGNKQQMSKHQSGKGKKFNGLDPETNELVFANGKPRPPGIDPITREYSTEQMLFDEMFGGNTSQPLDD